MPAATQAVDLTIHCTSFPLLSADYIVRESLIKYVRDLFSSERKVILIEGPSQTGKTTLAAQFARYFCDRTISYFIGDDYWTSNPDSFLQELCRQMMHIPGLAQSGKLRMMKLEELDHHHLSQAFNRLYAQMRALAPQKGPFYFVIDGVDKVNRVSTELSLLDLIPKGAENVYVLLTSRPGTSGFAAERIPMQWFSKEETEKLLKNYFSASEINEIYRICDGMPGYIKEIQRQAVSGVNTQDILRNMPTKFSDFLEAQWSSIDHSDTQLIDILSLISFGGSMEIVTLGQVLGIQPIDVERKVSSLTFVEVAEGKVSIRKAYKDFIAAKLESNKPEAIDKLIRYYEAYQGDKLLTDLPELYQKNDKYKELTHLINTQAIIDNLTISRRLSRVRHNLRILSRMAYEHHDWSTLAWASLTEAAFSRIAVSGSALESEVNALLSLNKHSEALELAVSCTLPEDRLKLLAAVCNYMAKNSLEISEDILRILEDSIELVDHSLDLNDEVIDGLLEVCANILPVQSKLALSLLEKVVSGATGAKQNLLDFLLMRLMLTAKTEFDTAEEIQTKLSNPERRTLLNALQSATEGIPADVILEQVKSINDIPTKLFLIESWCESNLRNPESIRVIDEALKIMTESGDDSPTLSTLRQIAMPLLYHEDIEAVQALVSRIDLIKETLLKNPIDQYAWLELTLARIVKKWSPNLSIERLYQVYVDLDEVSDLDTRCYVLARMLRNIPDIAPEDLKLEEEIRAQLETEYDQLLMSSADQLTITRRLIGTLTEYSVTLATDFADKLNTERRRNLAYGEILRVYTSGDLKNVDFDVIERLLDKISHAPYRDWVLVQVLRRLHKESSIDDRLKKRLVHRVQEIESPTGRAFALAHYIQWLHHDEGICKFLYDKMMESLNLIEPLTDRVEVGFRVTELLATAHKEFAEECYRYAVSLKHKRTFSDPRIESLYSTTCKLLLRTIPDIVKGNDWREKIESIKEAIMYVPSAVERCGLLSNLALRCNRAGKSDVFQAVAKTCLDLLEQCGDADSKAEILFETAPMLFEYERNLLFDKIQSLPVESRDIVLSTVVTYLLSKRPSDDPVDAQKFQGQIEYADAIRIVEVLDYMCEDSFIYFTIHCLVDCIVLNSRKYRNFNERQLLTIATRLKSIIEEKLPDPRNIRHEGYLLISLAELCRLRDLAVSLNSGARAKEAWKHLCPTWTEIQTQATAIANVSDAVFVMATCGVRVADFDENMASRFLNAAEEIHGDINNHIDRAERFQLLADSYFKAGKEHAARLLVTQALEAANTCRREEGRDTLLAKIVELAYSIDPSFADNIVSKMDSEVGRARIKDNVLALILHNDPSKLEQTLGTERKRVLCNAASRVFESLCSGRGIALHDNVIGQWIFAAQGHDFNTIYLITSWFIENSLIRRRQGKVGLEDFFNRTYDLLSMLRYLGMEFESAATKGNTSDFYRALSNVETYHVGQRQEAWESICNWLAENSEQYVKIYDPYFTTKELGILKAIPHGVSVTICTSMKTAEIEGRDLRQDYRRAWQAECDQAPPRTQVYIFHTKSGRTPMHNRYIISGNAGLELGTSLSGFGTKDSTIRFLDLNQKSQIEKELIDPLIIASPTKHLDEDLNLEMFVL